MGFIEIGSRQWNRWARPVRLCALIDGKFCPFAYGERRRSILPPGLVWPKKEPAYGFVASPSYRRARRVKVPGLALASSGNCRRADRLKRMAYHGFACSGPLLLPIILTAGQVQVCREWAFTGSSFLSSPRASRMNSRRFLQHFWQHPGSRSCPAIEQACLTTKPAPAGQVAVAVLQPESPTSSDLTMKAPTNQQAFHVSSAKGPN